MSGGQVCLKWNSFHSSLTSGFKSLWEEDGLVDVTLASDGRCIQAHKLILSACSPFFREVFKSNPCQHPVIILQDTHFSELESLLCFVYKGEVNIEQENLPALLKAAETLQIRGLSGASEQVQNELCAGSVHQEPENLVTEDISPSPPTKRSRSDRRQSPSSPRTRQPHYSRTKRSSRGSSRHLSVSVETILETDLSPERVPKVEPVEHDIGDDDDVTPILSVEDQVEDALFLGPVIDMKVQDDGRISATDTGQNKCYPNISEPAFHVEQSLQSFESNQVFNCLTASKKENPFPPYPCPFCERAYTSWGFRRRHIKAMHTQSERLSCKWCARVTETHENWKAHVSSEHGLSASDAHNGILILDEANMVLRIPNPQRLDTLVTMIRGSSAPSTFGHASEGEEQAGTRGPALSIIPLGSSDSLRALADVEEERQHPNATLRDSGGSKSEKNSEVSRDQEIENILMCDIKIERPDSP